MGDNADLERLSILIVEDNGFMRDLMAEVMRAIGIGRVFTAEDGGDAIDLLQTVATDPMKAGISIIDAIISDVFMPSLDGRMLLRWVRSSPKSPDRFVPVLMISGASDREIVENCRDLGASEFLTKPFSATSVAEKIMHVIMFPRSFVLAPTYFGPERRRTQLFQDTEKRVMPKEDIQVVQSEEPPKKLRTDAKVIVFKFRNRLADKIGGYSLKGIPEIDPELIEQAANKIESMAGDYAEWVTNSVRQMSGALSLLAKGEGDSKVLMLKLNTLAHEFRGQGGVFGYPLVTMFGKSLYEATMDENVKVTPNHIDFFKAHVDAINAVMTEKVKGDGGEVGRALTMGLKEAQENFATKSEELI
jgi:CheY-like chemotaxis protein